MSVEGGSNEMKREGVIVRGIALSISVEAVYMHALIGRRRRYSNVEGKS